MKIIKELSNQITDEIRDSSHYAKWALEVKDEYPSLAATLYKISLEETGHMNMLHGEVVKIINQYKADHGDPPAPMMDVYEYLHKQHIEDAVEAKAAQALFKENVTP